MIFLLDTNIYLDSTFNKDALSAVKKSLFNPNFVNSYKLNDEIRTYILKLSCNFYHLLNFSETLDETKLKESKPMKEIKAIREELYSLLMTKDKKDIQEFCKNIQLFFIMVIRGLPYTHPQTKEEQAKILNKTDIKNKKQALKQIKEEDLIVLLVVYDYARFEKPDYLTFVTRDITDIYKNKKFIEKELEIVTILKIADFIRLNSI